MGGRTTLSEGIARLNSSGNVHITSNDETIAKISSSSEVKSPQRKHPSPIDLVNSIDSHSIDPRFLFRCRVCDRPVDRVSHRLDDYGESHIFRISCHGEVTNLALSRMILQKRRDNVFPIQVFSRAEREKTELQRTIAINRLKDEIEELEKKKLELRKMCKSNVKDDLENRSERDLDL